MDREPQFTRLSYYWQGMKQQIDALEVLGLDFQLTCTREQKADWPPSEYRRVYRLSVYEPAIEQEPEPTE